MTLADAAPNPKQRLLIGAIPRAGSLSAACVFCRYRMRQAYWHHHLAASAHQ